MINPEEKLLDMTGIQAEEAISSILPTLLSVTSDVKVVRSNIKKAVDCDHLYQQLAKVNIEIRGFERRILNIVGGFESDGSVVFQREARYYQGSRISVSTGEQRINFHVPC